MHWGKTILNKPDDLVELKMLKKKKLEYETRGIGKLPLNSLTKHEFHDTKKN